MSIADAGFVSLVKGTCRRTLDEFPKTNGELKQYWREVLKPNGGVYSVIHDRKMPDEPHGKFPGSAAKASARTVSLVIHRKSLFGIVRFRKRPILGAESHCVDNTDQSTQWIEVGSVIKTFQSDQVWSNEADVEYKIIRAFGQRLYDICSEVQSKLFKDTFDADCMGSPIPLVPREEMATLFAINLTKPTTFSIYRRRGTNFEGRLRAVRKLTEMLEELGLQASHVD